eukprot:Pgem_evm1s10774
MKLYILSTLLITTLGNNDVSAAPLDKHLAAAGVMQHAEFNANFKKYRVPAHEALAITYETPALAHEAQFAAPVLAAPVLAAPVLAAPVLAAPIFAAPAERKRIAKRAALKFKKSKRKGKDKKRRKQKAKKANVKVAEVKKVTKRAVAVDPVAFSQPSDSSAPAFARVPPAPALNLAHAALVPTFTHEEFAHAAPDRVLDRANYKVPAFTHEEFVHAAPPRALDRAKAASVDETRYSGNIAVVDNNEDVVVAATLFSKPTCLPSTTEVNPSFPKLAI